jgi:hypothetical protein
MPAAESAYLFPAPEMNNSALDFHKKTHTILKALKRWNAFSDSNKCAV